MVSKVINVSIGLICQKGQILIGWRDESLHQGGCFEFPGGKVEPNETAQDAVVREVKEETGLEIDLVQLFHEESYEYPDRHVHLFFYMCHTDQNIPQPFERIWQWAALDQLKKFKFPAANAKIIERLSWPRSLGIVLATEHQVAEDVGLCYLKIDFNSITEVEKAIEFYFTQGVQLILNYQYYQKLNEALKQKIFAVHFNGQQLHQYQHKPTELKNINLIVACHDLNDIAQANKLACDAIFLSPVNSTTSHPNQDGMGWDNFQKIIQDTHLLVYALGGVQRIDLKKAQSYGGYGVAGIRDFIS